MPTRRSPGEGSLYFRKSTQRWYAELVLGHDAGQKRVTWRYSSKDKKATIAALAKAQADLASRQPQNHADQPLADYLAYWLETVRTTRSLRTWMGYRSIVTRHVGPAIGHIRLCDVRPPHIQSLYTALNGVISPATILHVHRALHRAFEQALRWEMVERNPVHLATPPRVPRREQTTLTTAQARMLLDCVQDDPLRAYWTLALTTGMRSSELAGLQWGDFDLDAGHVRIQRTLQRLAAQWVVKDTKTHQARSITLTDIGIAALREHRARQAEARLAAGPAWQNRELVFTSATGTPMIHWTRRRSWDRLLTKAGLPVIRMYDLRHTAASLLASWGVPVSVISEILGHSSNKLTWDTYITSMPSAQGDAMRTMDERLGSG